VIAVFRPTRPGDADAVLRCVRMLKAVRAVIERRAFCPTGKGGGVDNSCGSNKGGGGGGAGNAATIGSESGAVSHEQAKRVFRGASEKAISPDHGGTPEQKAERAEFKKRVVEETVSRVKERLSEDDVPESLLKAMRFDRPEYSEGSAGGEQKRTALVRGMVDRWADTSGDSDPPAVGVQRAIAAELSREIPDLKDSELKHLGQYGRRPISTEDILKARQIETLVGESGAVRAVVRAQYEATQQYFKEQGIKELTLHRGFHAPNLKESDDAEILMQPASSFSLNRRTAEMFANDMEYAFSGLATVTVPVSRVFSTPATGFGCLPEQEVVVLGGKVRGKLKVGGKK